MLSSSFKPHDDVPEYATRQKYIDAALKVVGWRFTGSDPDVMEEYPVEGPDAAGVWSKGRADYVLMGKNGKPLAVVEAKRTCRDPKVGRTQAVFYADCLQRVSGQRPMIFLTNGFETRFWDDVGSTERDVSCVFSKDDLERLMSRRGTRANLMGIKIEDKITDRYYQKEAIRAVCEKLQAGARKHLLVMATGTGKTRTAASLVDVLTRGNWVKNVLFLADRTALVKQAHDDFIKYLLKYDSCNLCEDKANYNAQLVFSTYPTVLNAIDDLTTAGGVRLYTPAHFDLIIIDESHRSIFKKYRAIFDYFDAALLGLTATPKTDVDRNTYDFFELPVGVPTYAYDYDTAVYKDHVLVPYYNYEVGTEFSVKGIHYDDLSDADKERYEDDFIEDGYLPKEVPSDELNKRIFNQNTVDTVLQDLMTRGIRVEGGDRLGKTIIFAQNKPHADYILKRFDSLYPQYHGKFAVRITCDDDHAQDLIEAFKIPDKEPYIAISVDMMDTGIDVPECVNLVFFKKVYSQIKFWQMIGRGTRLCKDLACVDSLDGEYIDKRRFIIFDYCGNFDFFRVTPKGYDSHEVQSLSERIFCRRVQLAAVLQEGTYAAEPYQALRTKLANACHAQITALNPELYTVQNKLKYVEKYNDLEMFQCLSQEQQNELIENIAPLVEEKESDEWAKRFDSFLYAVMLADAQKGTTPTSARKQLSELARQLESKASIPQVNEKLPLLKQVQTDDFWAGADVLSFENVRENMRTLIKFLDDGGSGRKPIYTNLADPILLQKEGVPLDMADPFEDYRARVNRYINEHGDMLAIHKLTHNIPLTAADYSELERILTCELGSREDYAREFGDTPLGLLVRKIAKLDHEAAMQAFSQFINDESLTHEQSEFVKKVIEYIEQNGYMDSATELQKPPFDRPIAFVRLFDSKTQKSLVEAVNTVRENAVKVV